MGAEIYLYLVTSGLEDEDQNLIARVSPRSQVRAGDSVKIAVELERVHVFDKDTERCIIH
jgi:multiple sugar transport system ATP-binding protein